MLERVHQQHTSDRDVLVALVPIARQGQCGGAEACSRADRFRPVGRAVSCPGSWVPQFDVCLVHAALAVEIGEIDEDRNGAGVRRAERDWHVRPAAQQAVIAPTSTIGWIFVGV